ncbi:MAG TPA: prolyl oligopeptidase family serine peptidase, partial [Streptosporangiaceae bacterium]|nr:prolyl oligopeptidase family serine peptidase [Streptosporangiaceae bacterium]
MTGLTGAGYPAARRLDLAENINGHVVADPYRWLEDTGSAETRAWLAAQDTLAGEQLAALPARPELAARIAELTATGFVSSPVWRGERCFFLRREPGQEHAALITAAPGEPDRSLIDPAALDESGATTLDDWSPDHEGRLLAYQLSHGGDEESVLRVLDVATGEQADGPIDRCRYTSVGWLPGGASFYYVRRLAPDAVPPGEQQYHRRVYLHTVGTPVSADTLIFGAGRDKTDYYYVSVSRDGHWLIMWAAQGTSPRNDLWLADLTSSPASEPVFRVIQAGLDARTSAHAGRDGRLYLLTDAGAPRGRLAVADPGHPGQDGWQDLIGEDTEAVLTDYAILDGEQAGPLLLALWARHAVSEITVHDLATGQRRGMVTLPGPGGDGRLGSISQLSERPEGGHEAWFSYTDYGTPDTVHHYDARTGEVTVWARAPGSAEIPAAASRLVSYHSADGTEVRMIVLSPPAEQAPAARPAAPRPAILTGYGGFAISLLTPAFSAAALAWVAAGGVYAIAGLRGGAEEGEAWHRAGMREHKQHVFDDFHAAAAKLVGDGWTTPGQLAISGGSNGG